MMDEETQKPGPDSAVPTPVASREHTVASS